MSVATTRAPTLAWLLTALTCLLVVMAIVESRRQAVAWPANESLGTVESVETAASTAAPAPSPLPTLLFASIPLPPSTGPATLRVARLIIPPGGKLPSEAAAGTTVLVVESGSLTVRVDGAVPVGQGLDAARTETVLGQRERLVIAPDAHYVLLNDGSAPAVALVAAMIPSATSTPELGPGEPSPGCPSRSC